MQIRSLAGFALIATLGLKLSGCQHLPLPGDQSEQPLATDSEGAVERQPQDTSAWSYGCRVGSAPPKAEPITFPPDDGWQFYIQRESRQRKPESMTEAESTQGSVYLTSHFDDFGVQAKWDGSAWAGVTLRNSERSNEFLTVCVHEGALVADVEILEAPSAQVEVGISSDPQASGFVDITEALRDLPMGVRQSISIDLRCFTGDRADTIKVDAPFSVETSGTLLASFSNIHYQPNMAQRASISCH